MKRCDMDEEEYIYLTDLIDSRIKALFEYMSWPDNLRNRSIAFGWFFDHLDEIKDDLTRAKVEFVMDIQFGLLLIRINQLAQLN